MKATIEIDATPQEMRVLLGLPNIEPLQEEVMQKLRTKMLDSLDNNDPVALMKMVMPMPEQFKAMESLQNAFWQSMMKGLDDSKSEAAAKAKAQSKPKK